VIADRRAAYNRSNFTSYLLDAPVRSKKGPGGDWFPARQILVLGTFLFALTLARANQSAHPFQPAEGKTEKSNR